MAVLFDADPADDADPDGPDPDGAGGYGRGGAARLAAWQQQWPRVAGLVLLGVLVLGLLWVVVTGLVARSRLDSARGELNALRTAVVSGDTATARRLVHDVGAKTHDAHALTSGPAWWITASLPAVGSPARTTRVIAEQADLLGRQALTGLPALTSQFTRPRHGAGRVDLDALTTAGPTLDTAGAAATHAVAQIRDSAGSWLPFVSSARSRVLTAFGRLAGELNGADQAVHILGPMLGQHGTKRYFIGFLNEAEARPLGGIPGAFAVATVTDGRVRFDRFGSDDDLSGVRAGVQLGAAYTARYRQDDPTGVFQNSDVSPDFRDAARIWAGMWQSRTGQHIDGALAVDPSALSYLLQAIGPARLPDGDQVSGRSVVRLTQSTQYTRYPGNSTSERNARKTFLDGIARAISDRLVRATDIRPVVKGLVRSAAERRLVVWSADPATERRLIAANWAGVLGSTDGSTYSGFTVTNGAGSKLDYYLRRAVTYQRFDCARGATATATLSLSNDAPRSGLPHYVTIRADKHGPGVRPGDNRLLVSYYAGAGARIVSVTLDGAPQKFTVQPEGNTLAATVAVELPAQATRKLVVSVREPASDRAVTLLRQPGVRAETTQVDDCR